MNCGASERKPIKNGEFRKNCGVEDDSERKTQEKRGIDRGKPKKTELWAGRRRNYGVKEGSDRSHGKNAETRAKRQK